jgi:hypothetical protein
MAYVTERLEEPDTLASLLYVRRGRGRFVSGRRVNSTHAVAVACPLFLFLGKNKHG